MMKSSGVVTAFSVVLLTLIIAGCISPPEELPLSNGTVQGSSPKTTNAAVPAITTIHQYITLVTPYITPRSTINSESTTSGYHVFLEPTPFPEERSCRIFTTTQPFMYNGTAFTFNLKNPPMYINYTVNPTNITGWKVYSPRTGVKTETMVMEPYNTYDPQSFLVITVRSKKTGEVYLKDGFGVEYTTYLKRTLKVMNQDDILVEIKGNKINGTINFWVKPVGNFDDPKNLTFDACTYWQVVPRDNLAIALINGTPTPTWVTPTTTATSATPTPLKLT